MMGEKSRRASRTEQSRGEQSRAEGSRAEGVEGEGQTGGDGGGGTSVGRARSVVCGRGRVGFGAGLVVWDLIFLGRGWQGRRGRGARQAARFGTWWTWCGSRGSRPSRSPWRGRWSPRGGTSPSWTCRASTWPGSPGASSKRVERTRASGVVGTTLRGGVSL